MTVAVYCSRCETSHAPRRVESVDGDYICPDCHLDLLSDLDESEIEFPDDYPDHHLLRTDGVYSKVFDDDECLLGHVTMLDYDEVDEQTVVEDAERLPGCFVMVESSEGRYHLYDLRVQSWESVVETMQESRASESYVEEMVDQERAVLRTGDKIRQTGYQYREGPTPLSVHASADALDANISGPHLSRLINMCPSTQQKDIERTLRSLSGMVDSVGHSLSETYYESLSDELREAIHG